MARRCGVSDVWALTPREWYREVITWKEREETLLNSDMTHAWMVANLTRAKKMPALKTLLVGEAATTKPQTIEDHRKVLQSVTSRIRKRATRG